MFRCDGNLQMLINEKLGVLEETANMQVIQEEPKMKLKAKCVCSFCLCIVMMLDVRA